MLYAVVIILFILTVFLGLKLFLLKRQLKRTLAGMDDNTEYSLVKVDFVDRDLQELVVRINSLYGKIMSIKAEGAADEKKLRESISMISHDMRTPLTSIIGYLQIADKACDDGELRHNIETALERAGYLNRLVNDFFEISLIDSDNLNMTPVKLNVCEVICEEILAESPELDRKGISPVFPQADDDIFIMADRRMFSRVIQNLTSNAVKYSDSRLEYAVECSAEKTVIRIISDAVPGVDTDRIFDRFYMDDSSRTRGGTGLGLYIVRRFVENMNGTVTATQDDTKFEISMVFINPTNSSRSMQ